MLLPSDGVFKKALEPSKTPKKDKLDYAKVRMKRYGTTLTQELAVLEGFTVHKQFAPKLKDTFFFCQPEGQTHVEGNPLFITEAPDSPQTNVN